jgi:hypothetical protein
MKEIPSINNFEEDFGKFIQVYVNDKPYMRIGAINILHGQIFRQLLNELNIPFNSKATGYVDENDNVSSIMIPLKRGDLYELVGAGFVQLDKESLEFYGNSIDYNPLGVDENHLYKIAKNINKKIILK